MDERAESGDLGNVGFGLSAWPSLGKLDFVESIIWESVADVGKVTTPTTTPITAQ